MAWRNKTFMAKGGLLLTFLAVLCLLFAGGLYAHEPGSPEHEHILSADSSADNNQPHGEASHAHNSHVSIHCGADLLSLVAEPVPLRPPEMLRVRSHEVAVLVTRYFPVDPPPPWIVSHS